MKFMENRVERTRPEVDNAITHCRIARFENIGYRARGKQFPRSLLPGTAIQLERLFTECKWQRRYRKIIRCFCLSWPFARVTVCLKKDVIREEGITRDAQKPGRHFPRVYPF